jgi:hypothetical protein
MKTLYLKLTELLSEIPELKYIDLNCGQLQEEKPPIAYPAVLINLNANSTDIDGLFQLYTGTIELTIVCKILSESNNNAPENVRERSLKYLELSEKIWKKLQGYNDADFDKITRLTIRDQNIRKGLKTSVQTFETSWRQIA